MTMHRIWKTIPFVFAALLLASCTTAQRAAVNQGVKQIQDFNDGKARLIKAETCGVSLGAYFRVFTEVEQRAFDVLCGGQWERPVTADDLRTLRDLRDLFNAPPR